jgi:hypothetical protein
MPFLLVKPEPSSQIAERPKGRGAGFVEAPGEGPLAYRFDYWLGDDLVGSPPVFLVTARLKQALSALDPAPAFRFDAVRVEASPFYRESNPERALPDFWRWRFEGRAGKDDAGLWGGHDLVVSGRVFAALLSGRLEQAEILQFRQPAPPA